MKAEEYLKEQRDRVNAFLDEYLPPEDAKPQSIHRAIRYSVFSGGKRFRAALAIAAYELFRGDSDRVLPVAGGIELIHAYSLIHDDLPCMDDDDFRRGKPTLHRVHGENIAVLAGDALNALAFDLVSQLDDCRLIRVLANAIGTDGMIGGQVADVESEKRSDITADDVNYIHTHKTAALIRASLEMGSLAAGASEAESAAVCEFGSLIGLAFQVVDDILDIVSSSEVLGKDVGSDEEHDKATYPKVYGLDNSRELARDMVDRSYEILESTGRDIMLLKGLAEFVVSRVY